MVNYNGYLAIHRNAFYLLKKKILKVKEFTLWQYLITQMDFDPKHLKYGTFEYFPEEIGEEVFHTGRETVESWYKKLKTLGLIHLVDEARHLWAIHNPARYVVNSALIHGEANKYQKQEVNNPLQMLENIGTNTEKIEESTDKFTNIVEKNRQDEPTLLKRSPSIAKGSYKNDLVSSPYGVVGGEYSGSLSLDDQGWILSQRFREVKI